MDKFFKLSSSSLVARVSVISLVSVLFTLTVVPAALADTPVPTVTYGSTDPNIGIGTVTAPILTPDGIGYVSPSGTITTPPGGQTIAVSGNTNIITELVTGAGGVAKRIGTDFTSVLSGYGRVSATAGSLAWKWASSLFANSDVPSSSGPYGSLIWTLPLSVQSDGLSNWWVSVPLSMVPGTGGFNVVREYQFQSTAGDGFQSLYGAANCTTHYPASYRTNSLSTVMSFNSDNCNLTAPSGYKTTGLFIYTTPGPDNGDLFYLGYPSSFGTGPSGFYLGFSQLAHSQHPFIGFDSNDYPQFDQTSVITTPAYTDSGLVVGISPTPVVVISNPARRIATVEQCETVAGIKSSQTFIGTQQFTETDAALPALTPGTCSSGTGVPISVSWYIETLDSTSGIWTRSNTALQSIAYPDAWTSPSFPYTQCVVGSLAGSCTLTLIKVTSSGQDPCVVGSSAVDCTTWVSGISASDSTQYECEWGPYVLPVSGCSSLFGVYAPSAVTNVPIIATATDTAASGSNYASISQCIPSGWSFSSILHIATLSSCIIIQSALTLFIPTQDELNAQGQKISGSIKGSGVGVVIDALAGFVTPVTSFVAVTTGLESPATVSYNNLGAIQSDAGPAASGCEGPATTVPIGSLVTAAEQQNHNYDSINGSDSAHPHPMPSIAFSGYARSDLIAHLFSTCYNPAKTISYWLRFFLTGLIFITTLMLAINIVLGSIGLHFEWLNFQMRQEQLEERRLKAKGGKAE